MLPFGSHEVTTSCNRATRLRVALQMPICLQSVSFVGCNSSDVHLFIDFLYSPLPFAILLAIIFFCCLQFFSFVEIDLRCLPFFSSGELVPLTLLPKPYLHSRYTLHPARYTLHPTPHTLHPAPYTLHPTPYTPHPTPHTLHPTPCTLHPRTEPATAAGGLSS